MSESNPYNPEAVCQECNESFPEDLVMPYVKENTDKKGKVTHEKVRACALCIAALAGQRAGLKTPYDFKDDPDMAKKVLYAQNLRNSRSQSDDSAEEEAEEKRQAEEEAESKRLAEEEAEAQRQLDEEEAERQRLEKEDSTTDMLETEQSEKLKDETPKRRGRG